MIKPSIVLLFFSFLILAGCSTTGHFKVPPNTTLKVADHNVELDAAGNWDTSPFFWSESEGFSYQILNKGGSVARSGKLKSRFRFVSIFWPPFAWIYWPLGFDKNEMDLTKPGDGDLVRDDATSHPVEPAVAPTVAPAASAASAAPAADAAPAETPKKKKKKQQQ